MVLLTYREKDLCSKCDAFSRKETKHVNERVKQAVVPGEQAKVGMKRSATRGSYTGYTSEESEDRKIRG